MLLTKGPQRLRGSRRLCSIYKIKVSAHGRISSLEKVHVVSPWHDRACCCSVPQRSRIEGDPVRGDIVFARSCNMITLRKRASFPNNYPFHTASYLSSHSCSLHISTTSLAPIFLFSSPRPPSHPTTHHAPPPPRSVPTSSTRLPHPHPSFKKLQ